MRVELTSSNRLINGFLAPFIFWFYFFTFRGIHKIRQIGDLLIFTIQSHILYFLGTLSIYSSFELEDSVPTLVLMFLICNVILQYYLGYRYRRIYKVLVEDELSQEENNVPLIRAVGYAVDRIFLNIVYLVLFIFMGIGAISNFITNGAIGLVFLALSVIFFILLRRSLKKSDLTGEEYEKDVERHYQLVKHLQDAATLFETITKK